MEAGGGGCDPLGAPDAALLPSVAAAVDATESLATAPEGDYGGQFAGGEVYQDVQGAAYHAKDSSDVYVGQHEAASGTVLIDQDGDVGVLEAGAQEEASEYGDPGTGLDNSLLGDDDGSLQEEADNTVPAREAVALGAEQQQWQLEREGDTGTAVVVAAGAETGAEGGGEAFAVAGGEESPPFGEDSGEVPAGEDVIGGEGNEEYAENVSDQRQEGEGDGGDGGREGGGEEPLFDEGGGVGEEDGHAADSDAEREKRRRQKRERREKRREKKKRRKEKKKKKKKQFAEDEAEESEGQEEIGERGAEPTAEEDDDVRDFMGGDAEEGDEEPTASADTLLQSREREAAAAADHLQHTREDSISRGGSSRGSKKQRRAAGGDRHVSFYDADETAPKGTSEDGDAATEREEESRRRTVTAFDRALERIRLRKKRRLPLSNEECSLYCNKLLQQMSDAMQADLKAMEEGRPATAKLQMLDFACAELVKPKWRHWFLAEGCCQCIAAWLAPHRDNSLSNFTLRNKLLHVLAKLPITSQDLQSNDLGRVLVLLWDHPEEGDTNRVLIRQLIQRWIRPMLGLGSSHREFLQERDRALEANDLELQQKLVAAANANIAASQTEGEEGE